MKTVEGILIECAKLRGTEDVMNRTLHEFNWFVQSAVFGNELPFALIPTYPNSREIYTRYHSRMSCSGGELLWWATLFHEHCKGVYGGGEC